MEAPEASKGGTERRPKIFRRLLTAARKKARRLLRRTKINVASSSSQTSIKHIGAESASYPKELNPFDEDNNSPAKSPSGTEPYPNELNPFDEEINEEKTTSGKVVRKKRRAPMPPTAPVKKLPSQTQAQKRKAPAPPVGVAPYSPTASQPQPYPEGLNPFGYPEGLNPFGDM